MLSGSPFNALAHRFVHRLLLTLPIVGGVLSHPSPARAADTYTDADGVSYVFYAPPAPKVLRGLVVFFHGSGGDGTFYPDVQGWQAFADTFGFGLFSGHWTPCLKDVSVLPLNDVMTHFAESSGHPELPNLPWAVHGFSCGGWTVQGALGLMHDRIIAAEVRSGGMDPWPSDIPLWVTFGVNDIGPTPLPTANGLMSSSTDWGVDHRDATNQAIAMAFFSRVISRRLPKDADASTGPVKLLPMERSAGWLGDRTDPPTVAPYADFAGDKAAAHWLPDEYMARIWQSFGDRTTTVEKDSVLKYTHHGSPQWLTSPEMLTPDIGGHQFITFPIAIQGPIDFSIDGQPGAAEMLDGDHVFAQLMAPGSGSLTPRPGVHALMVRPSSAALPSRPIVIMTPTPSYDASFDPLLAAGDPSPSGGMAGAAGGSTSAGAGGAAPAVGGGGAAGSSASTSSNDGKGCSCTSAGSRRGTPHGLWALLGAIGLTFWRRKSEGVALSSFGSKRYHQ